MEARVFYTLQEYGFYFSCLAIVNAVIRETLYESKLGDNLGYAFSSIIAVVYTLAVICLFVNHVKADVTKIDLLLIGVFWLALTVIFEFGFGHYVMGRSWECLLADYTILKGRLWSLVLLITFVSPLFLGIFSETRLIL